MPELGPQDRVPLLDYKLTLDCVHCGLCLPDCPTYQETGRETSSPRGRIYLMRGVAEGRLALDRKVSDEMNFCLACRACETACPAGVQYGRLVEGMRAEAVRRGVQSGLGATLERFTLRNVVARPRVLRTAATLLRLYQRSGLQRAVRKLGVLRVAPGLAAAERTLPDLPTPHRPPLLVPARTPRRGRVAFFQGCIMPEVLGSANQATIDVLTANGFEVQIPRGQGCCGALHLHSGDPDTASQLHARNRSAFRLTGVDAIISNSAGCGAALKEYRDDFSDAVRDVSEFLVDAGLRPPPRPLPLRVAYDDACHLLHGQGVRDAPRALLSAIPELELFDLPGSSDCCGAAGIYNLTQPEMSKRLLDRKVEALRKTAPDVLATGNPGCLLQFATGAREAGLQIDIRHPVELLARAYGAG